MRTLKMLQTLNDALRRWAENAQLWTDRLLDALWPRACLVCGHRLLRDERLLCIDCLMSLPLTRTMQSPEDNTLIEKLCGWGRVERAVAAYYYEQQGIMSTIVGKVKYRGWKELGVMIGHVAAEDAAAAKIFADVDAIVPVPLHRRRQKERGYNQSEQIARGMAEVIGKPVITNAFERLVYQEHQVKMTILERRTNIHGAFGNVNASLLAGRHILLVDDVITTGTTTGECINTLQTSVPDLRVSVFSLTMAK